MQGKRLGSHMKRFYKLADTMAADDGHRVTLDAKPIRTPAGAPLAVPNADLARVIAEEWTAQGDTIVPASMPMMSLASTAIDRVAPQCRAVATELAGYAGSDLLCYRAEQPVDLVSRQAKAWQPMLDWAAQRYGARLALAAGVLHVAQEPEALDKLAAAVAPLDAFRLSGLHVLTTVFGSLVLALAVYEGKIAPMDAFDRSRIDEDWQAELWGADEEAAELRDALASEVDAAARFLGLLGQ